MKVIVIKKYKNWKVNEVIETSDGFAKNFLIKKGYAISYNDKNQNKLKIKMNAAKKETEIHNVALKVIKKQIEQVTLNFSLKVSDQDVIGSISTKSVSKKLLELNIKIPKHSLEAIHIKSIGTSYININLSKEIIARLKIEVVGEHV